MRFSSLFQQASQPREPRREELPADTPRPLTTPAPELPDDLDARVRLVGEWQLGES